MRTFEEIYAIAADRKGGPEALEAMLPAPLPQEALRNTTDDRWLATMAKCIFQAGFNWKVIEAKWDGFEAAFDGFDVARVGFYHDKDLDRLLGDERIVRNGQKIQAVLENARFLMDLAKENGTAARFFADWPVTDQIGLTKIMSKQGSRLGAMTGQRVLREMGRDSFILTTDVLARLKAEGIIDASATSSKAQTAIQSAFNKWMAESGRGLTQISRVLAYSV
ncbi:MAG: DNA-3-methyladenine glycosylase I [Pseudomonadota bacterium]|nr:DNA-3-methyladenine glycosylase I [Pseudomonadota bacterium]MEE3071917.1 DNA-3-methyladenine glycosylase I [Pseudomonadota bacterium]